MFKIKYIYFVQLKVIILNLSRVQLISLLEYEYMKKINKNAQQKYAKKYLAFSKILWYAKAEKLRKGACLCGHG